MKLPSVQPSTFAVVGLKYTHINDVQRLINAGLLVEAEPRIHLRADLARHDLQDLAAELHKQVVQRGVDLSIDVLAMLLAVGARIVDELSVLGLLRRSEDERWVGRGVLRLVLVDGGEVARVADDDLVRTSVLVGDVQWHSVISRWYTYSAGSFQLIKRRRHICGFVASMVVCQVQSFVRVVVISQESQYRKD